MAYFLYGSENVKLPALPEFEKQYAFIFRANEDGSAVYYLTIRDAKKTVNTGGIAVVVGDMYISENGEWVATSKTTGGTIIWANYDVYYSDSVEEVGGTLYLAASEPVPVTTFNLHGESFLKGLEIGKLLKKKRYEPNA